MTGTASLDVIDALLRVAQGHFEQRDVLVLDGIEVTSDPGDFLMIGVEDPDSDQFESSASTTQQWAHAGGSDRDEDGTITCCALSWNGDNDLQAGRDGCRRIIGELTDALLQDPTLGLDHLLWVQPGQSWEVSQARVPGGASVMAVFQIFFRARLSAGLHHQ